MWGKGSTLSRTSFVLLLCRKLDLQSITIVSACAMVELACVPDENVACMRLVSQG
jgi:hypothetical protein